MIPRLLLCLVLLQSTRIFLPVVAQQSGAHTSTKKGCAGCSCDQMATVGAVVTYGYNPSGGVCQEGQIRFPMIRSATDPIPDTLVYGLTATGTLMGFNEPDNCRPGGTCTSTEDVARAWREMERVCGNCRLVGPVPTNLTNDWYLRFWQAYRQLYGTDPKVDVLPVHCAFTPDAVGFCQDYTAGQIEIARSLGIPTVWVTEFATLPMHDWSIHEAQEAGAEFIAWMESEPMIEHYFIFAGTVDPAADWAGGGLWNSLYWATDKGKLTWWGEWYRGQP